MSDIIVTSDTPLHFIVAAHAVKIQKLCLFGKDIYKKALFCHFVTHYVWPKRLVSVGLCVFILCAVWPWTFYPFCFSINLWNNGRNALCLSAFCVFIPCYTVLCVLSFCFSTNLLKSDRNVSCLSILCVSSAGCRHAGLKLQCFFVSRPLCLYAVCCVFLDVSSFFAFQQFVEKWQ